MKSSLRMRGFTLVELLITTMILSVTGWMSFLFLNAGTILFARNTAMNVAHQQARTAIAQMQFDVHSAVSIPQLVDASRASVSGNGPAAGLSFQVVAGGNCQINASAAATATSLDVRVPTGYAVPIVGQKLIVATHQIEKDITSISAQGSGVYRCNFGSVIGTAVDVGSGSTTYNVICFATNRVSYVVVGGELRYYANATTSSFSSMARNVTNATPFQIPSSSSGSPSNRFVAAVNLSTDDSSSNHRGFRAANMFLSTQIPYRARLTTYQ